jgi:hypothetical protein
MTVTPRRVFIGIMILAVVATIGASMWVAGSPAEARLRALDERRVQHLQTIQQWVTQYVTARKALPSSLGVLSRDPVGAMLPTDPETGAQYEYRVTGDRAYELCATFAREGDRDNPGYGPYSWPHGAGRQCFQRDAH